MIGSSKSTPHLGSKSNRPKTAAERVHLYRQEKREEEAKLQQMLEKDTKKKETEARRLIPEANAMVATLGIPRKFRELAPEDVDGEMRVLVIDLDTRQGEEESDAREGKGGKDPLSLAGAPGAALKRHKRMSRTKSYRQRDISVLAFLRECQKLNRAVGGRGISQRSTDAAHRGGKTKSLRTGWNSSGIDPSEIEEEMRQVAASTANLTEVLILQAQELRQRGWSQLGSGD